MRGAQLQIALRRRLATSTQWISQWALGTFDSQDGDPTAILGWIAPRRSKGSEMKPTPPRSLKPPAPVCCIKAGLFCWFCLFGLGLFKAMGYAANTPSHPIPPIPAIGWPSNEKNSQIHRAIGQHPNIKGLPSRCQGCPPGGNGINKVPSYGRPTGCYDVQFYPHPTDRPT